MSTSNPETSPQSGSHSTSPSRPDPIIDPRLLDAARRGEREALRRLLEPEVDRLHAVCARMLGPRRREEARDLLQDALVKIIRGLPGFDGRSSFSTWATRVAMNACLSHLRAERRRRERATPAHAGEAGSVVRVVGPDGQPMREGNGEPQPETGVQEQERGAMLARGLATLSPEHRAIIVLRDVRQLGYEAIGEVLGLSAGTVKSRLFRARSALRNWMERAEGEGPESETAADATEAGDGSERDTA